jgi:hypothetical protein
MPENCICQQSTANSDVQQQINFVHFVGIACVAQQDFLAHLSATCISIVSFPTCLPSDLLWSRGFQLYQLQIASGM